MKIINEHIEHFTRGSENKLDTLGIGKRKAIEFWMDEHGFGEENYTIQDDLSILLDFKDMSIWDFIEYIEAPNEPIPSFIKFNYSPDSLMFISSINHNLKDFKYSLEHGAEIYDLIMDNMMGNKFYEGIKYLLKKYNKEELPLGYYNRLKDYLKISNISESFTRDSNNKLESIGVGKRKMIEKWLENNGLSNFDYTINDVNKIIPNFNSLIFTDFINLLRKHKPLPSFIKIYLTGFARFLTSVYMKDIEEFKKSIPKEELIDELVFNKILTNNFVDAMKYLIDNQKKYIIPQNYIIKMKDTLSKQNIDESFTRESKDKLTIMGIGKINLIKTWLERCGIEKYIINNDLTITVNGNVNLDSFKFGNFPDYIQFRDVYGWFDINSDKMTSLRGCPSYVQDFFSCSNNYLESLDFAPKNINGSFYCAYNYKISKDDIEEYLQKINHSEKKVFEAFIKGNDKLATLGVGKPGMITNWLRERGAEQVKIHDDGTIDVKCKNMWLYPFDPGNPADGNLPDYIKFGKIDGSFFCENSGLTSLKGFPYEIDGDFDIQDNEKLRSLKGLPKKINGEFYCGNIDMSRTEIDKYMFDNKIEVTGDIYYTHIN